MYRIKLILQIQKAEMIFFVILLIHAFENNEWRVTTLPGLLVMYS